LIQRCVNLEAPGIKLVSFDVFDTVIARHCGAPETIFRIVGEKLRAQNLLPIGPRAFERMRIEAERCGRQHRGAGEITLPEIYTELNRLWFLPETTLAQMLNCELETERENLFAIPGMRTLIQRARRSGKRIAFISDMYLPEDFICSVLAGLDLWREGDRLYVSSRWRASKADGGLFRIVLEQEQLGGEAVIHFGDSLHADVLSARTHGIRARQITRGALNRFETALGQAEATTFEQAGTLAGYSRRARLAADETGDHSVAARLGASLAGPMLTAYAEWVLRAARKRKLQQLYFLARDGEALLRLCEVLAPAVGAEGIELKYFYGSREVWSPAALVNMDETAGAFFATQIAYTASTWEHCVEYLGFTAADIKRTALPVNWMAKGRTSDWKKQIFLDLAADSVWGPRLQQRLAAKAVLLARYVREQGLADQVPCGLVDCGWSGTWTDILGDVITAEGGMKPLVFFIGRRKRSAPPRYETLAWMFDHQTGGGLKHVPDCFHVVAEFLLTAGHGRTTGFEEGEGRLRPKLEAVDWQGFNPDAWRVFRNALLNFARLYAGQLHPDGEAADLRIVLTELVVLLWEQPTVAEAQFLARHTIGLSPTRANTKTLARPYGWNDALRLAARGQLPGYPPFWWHAGAQALSGSAIRMTLGIMWELRELLRALRDHRAGLEARRLTQLLSQSAKHLQRGCARREENDFCRFQGAQPERGAETIPPPPTVAPPTTTVAYD